MSLRALVPAALVLAALAACKPPHRDVPAKDVPSLNKLDEVMDVQATVADPWFGKKEFGEGDWAKLTDVSERIQATSARTKAFSRGAGFDALADRLGETAKQLGDAAGKKDAAGSADALAAMKATCKECHSKFR